MPHSTYYEGEPITMNQEPIDISRTISTNALVYPGDSPIEVTPLCKIGPDSPCNILQLGGWTTHFLTHVDPPLHFVKDGASLDEIPLSRFIGDTLVIEADGDAVSPSHIPSGDEIKGLNILFKTRNSATWNDHVFNENHVYVSGGAAELAVARGVNLVGIDYISIDRFGDEAYPAHRTLLQNGILILEGLDLTHVTPGRYTLIALPLRIAQGDGSPVRAVLIPQF